jgi:transcriptional regulator with XRE-family HTH domain
MLSIPRLAQSLAALGRRLRDRRLELGWTQAHLAEKLGVSVPTVRAMERGDAGVSIGLWGTTLWIFDQLDAVDRMLLDEQASLLQQAQRQRQRAPRRRS